MSAATLNKQKTYKVLIADDHAIFRHGLRSLLNTYYFVQFSGEASNGKELLELVKQEKPDLIFLDIHMPNGDGIEATPEILNIDPNIKIVILSSYDDAIMVKKMMDLGVSAYLTKTITTTLLNTLFEKIGKDEVFISPDATNNMVLNKLTTSSTPSMIQHTQWLENEISPRQKQVLDMLINGKSTKEISTHLKLGSRTIETHRVNLLKKFGVKTTPELVAKAREFKVV